MLNPSKAVPLQHVQIDNPFWSHYLQLVRDTVIPYQWEALNDRVEGAEPSHAIQNFRIAAGREQGEFHGFVFQDSDLAKWLEAVGYSLMKHPDPHLEQLADDSIDLIGEAQEADGYLNTYFTIQAPNKRWTNLGDCHELYCAGHMIEAAVSYYQATGKHKLLDIVCRFADLIDSTFGTKPGQLRGYCGHQEIELALVKLYQTTQEVRYLHLSQYFIDERGASPSYLIKEWEQRGKTSYWANDGVSKAPDLSNSQSHLPVREQSAAVGHSVRAVYMYTAMADLAALSGDQALIDACRRLWGNIITKQMYLTGGVGATVHGEAFTFDYDLPNDTIYAETCASIGLIFFAHRMLQLEAKSEYADVMERALYNNVIGSMSLDGKHYFYVNPLEVWPNASEKNPTRHHVKAVRQPWFGCSCCPPNVARLLASLGQYIYSTSANTIYTHLYIGGAADLELNGQTIGLQQKTNYPWDGEVSLTLSLQKQQVFALALRLPGWCDSYEITINGEKVITSLHLENGYIQIERAWNDGDIVSLNLTMEVQRMQSHPLLRANAGKIALQRGPLVYCLEEEDNVVPLASISLSNTSKLTAKFDPDLLGGIIVLEGDAQIECLDNWNEHLYRPQQVDTQSRPIKAVPYFLWGNRTPGEMTVWVRST